MYNLTTLQDNAAILRRQLQHLTADQAADNNGDVGVGGGVDGGGAGGGGRGGGAFFYDYAPFMGRLDDDLDEARFTAAAFAAAIVDDHEDATIDDVAGVGDDDANF
jgi:hypothetical protein